MSFFDTIIKKSCKTTRNPVIPLFLIFLTLYVFSAGGHLYSIDEVQSYLTTRAIAEKGSLNIAYAIPFLHELGFFSALPENTSVLYSKYGPAHAALAVPFYFVGTWLGVDQWRIIDLLYSPTLSAASVCLVYGIARRLRVSHSFSIVLSLLFGFTTIAWPYAKFFFDVTTATFTQLAAVYFLFHPTMTRRSLFLSGLFATLSVLARITQALVLPGMLLYVAFRHRIRLRTGITSIGTFITPIAAGAIVYVYLNLVRFNSPFTTGYAVSDILFNPQFLVNPLIGVFGMLFSSGEGLFIFYPICAVGFFSLFAYDKSHTWEGVIFGWFFFSNLLFFGRLIYWHGMAAWGARYLVTSAPYLVLAAAPFVESAKTSIVRALVVVFAAAVGFFSNIMGVLMNFLYVGGYLAEITPYWYWNGSEAAPPGIWIPSFSPLRASWDLIWSQKYPATYFPYVREIFYLKARFDLFVYNSFGTPALVVGLTLGLLETLWLVKTLKER
jgi:hypothetical protein